MKKKCSKCDKIKQLSSFHKSARSRDGHKPACKTCASESNAALYGRDRERILARNKNWNAAHKDVILKAAKKWDNTHPEDAAKRAKKYWKENLEICRARCRDYQKRNPDIFKAKNHKHEAAKRDAGGSFTAAEWKALCKKYHNRCLGCGKRRKLTADHVVPVSKGGSSNISNIQLLCGPCNSSKGNKTIDYRKRRDQ